MANILLMVILMVVMSLGLMSLLGGLQGKGDDDTFKINVNTLGLGSNIKNLEIKPSTTTYEVKEMIYELRVKQYHNAKKSDHFKPDNTELSTPAGEKMDNNQTLSHYNIKDGDELLFKFKDDE